MLKSFSNLGQYGINKDLSSHELPVNAWTDGQNARFEHGLVKPFFGHCRIYEPPTVVPYHVVPVTINGSRYWIYAGAGKIYCVNGSTHTDLTRASGGDYTGVPNKWISTVLGGIPILNDGSGSNLPQFWDLNLANNFGNLTNWPASTYCKSIRAFKGYLIALNITKTSTNYAYMVKWSHPADPGAVPASWDETDPTKDAGEFDLSEGQDIIVDGLQLRDNFIIYKESSIWMMNYIGGTYIFNFRKIFAQGGMLTKNCAVDFNGMHCVLTGDDIIAHNGETVESVIDGQTRRHIFSTMDSDAIDKCFVFKNPYLSEIYICYAESGNTVPNIAMVWNYKDDTTTFRDLPNVHHASTGLVESTLAPLADSWAVDSDSWDSDVTTWNQAIFTPDAVRVVMASSDTHLYLLDAQARFDTDQPTVFVERRGLALGNPEAVKLVKRVMPRIKGTDGETVIVKIGYADDPYSDPTYTSTTYTIGTTVTCDALVSGRYIAIRIESGTALQWRMDSMDVEYSYVGKW